MTCKFSAIHQQWPIRGSLFNAHFLHNREKINIHLVETQALIVSIVKLPIRRVTLRTRIQHGVCQLASLVEHLSR